MRHANFPKVEEGMDEQEVSLILRLMGTAWSLLALAVMLSFWQAPYPCVLISPFRAHWVAALLTVGLPMALFYPHPRRWVFLAMPLAVSVTFYPYFVSRAQRVDPSLSGRTRLVVSNLNSANLDLSRFTAWVEQEKPDVVALVEVSEEQRAQLESMPFEYKALHPRRSNFGLGLLSKTAPLSVQMLDEDSPFPSLLATWPEYRLLVTHPMPPVSRAARDAGDEQLIHLLSMDDHSLPLVIAGDLNATGWDLRLQPLKDAGLEEARMGHGFMATWPADRPMPGIPIDHVFMPTSWDSLAFCRGPDIGSDHFPLFCELAYPLGTRGAMPGAANTKGADVPQEGPRQEGK